jgi:hypothetical protein
MAECAKRGSAGSAHLKRKALLPMLGALLSAGIVLASTGAAQDTLGSPPTLPAPVPAETVHVPAAEPAVVEQSRLGNPPISWLVSDNSLDRERLAEIRGRRAIPHLLLRSTSVLLRSGEPGGPAVRLLGPEMQLVYNSRIPWSMNNGAMWAGRGLNTRTMLGFAADLGRVHFVLAPEVVTSANRDFDLRVEWIERPPIPPERSEWQFEWYAYGPYSIDLPTRFGADPIRRIFPGQSSLAVAAGPVELGIASENQWWGPGINNALILSNNAAGFPHVFLRASRPLETRLGEVDFRWLVGGLKESRFFDTVTTNNLRSLAAGAATLRLRWPEGLTLGAARSVWSTAGGWGDVWGRWFDVFRVTGRPNNRLPGDSALYPGGREQLYSFFGRWVMPAANLETYFEWGRTELPGSLRDLFVDPGHTQGYTVGLQWARQAFGPSDLLRLQAENTSVERSASSRHRPVGVWYTSRQVIQGYTNRGQPLGAAVGPGSSGQQLRVDYLRPNASLGLVAGRIRYNEDVRVISQFPLFKSWCTHDIYLYWGARAGARAPFGQIELEFIPAERIQAWFQVGSGCPRGDAMVDIPNRTLRLTLSR